MKTRILGWLVATLTGVAWIAAASAGCGDGNVLPAGVDAATDALVLRDTSADGTIADAGRLDATVSDGAPADAPSDALPEVAAVDADAAAVDAAAVDAAGEASMDAGDAGPPDADGIDAAPAYDGGAGIGFDGGVCVLRTAPCPGAPELLPNGTFEAVGTGTGQGILPTGWVQVNPSADTYSNDGSYGLAPSAFNNFTGVTAHDGIRWVAGWSQVPERFGAATTATFVTGHHYRIAAFLHRATSHVGDGTYEVSLTDELPRGRERVVGEFCPLQAGALGWEERSFDFVAPAPAVLDFIGVVFTPDGANILSDTYPGVDTVSITDVTSCR